MTTSASCEKGNVEAEVLISSGQESDSSDDGGPLGYLSDRPPSEDESLLEEDDEDIDDKCLDEPEESSSQGESGDASGIGDSTIAADPLQHPHSDGQPASKRKKPPGDASTSKSKPKRKKASERRNIRKILKGTQLDANTLAAQQDEFERKRRLQERLRDGLPSPELEANSISEHLKGLLEEAEKQAASLESQAILKPKQPTNDVVEVIDSDEDECIIVHDTERERDDQDPENSGSHVNDSLNVRDHLGRVLVNVNHPASDPDIFLSSRLAKAVKPHQIGGIRFLYDNAVESMTRFNNSAGFGCILAHSMGLGKTMQVIGFVDVFLRHTNASRVLIIVPINTLQNWVAEFDMWLPVSLPGGCEDTTVPIENGSGLRTFNVHVVNETHKTIGARAAILEKWTKDGGVLLMGYEMYRLLSTRVARNGRRRKNVSSEVIDLDEEDRNKELQIDMQNALVDPGPDLVICDEGHRIKNSHAGISQTLKNLKTRRRIVLTGYPLQNNLMEYWCMVDFVRPNFLGTKVEFGNMFDRPITNGQCADSTPSDVTLMRYRAHVLHSLLEGFVQRRNHKVLRLALPPKEEWVLMIKMSQTQRVLYKAYMDNLQQEMASSMGSCMNPIKAFSVCCKIWNHPDVLAKFLRSKKGDDDLDFDLARAETCRPSANGSSRGRLKKSASCVDMADGSGQTDDSVWQPSDKKEQEISYDWALPLLSSYVSSILENSGKMVLLFDIIERTVLLGEKLLVFSQSLFTLDLIEEYLTCRPLPLLPCHDGSNYPEFWARNKTYFRLDGSTPGMERERLVSQFNEPGSRASLFLLSTRAGCLGINLTGASRVVIMDASWNPCHDCQAVCRVYRYGQKRPCYIYRLVADNTLEKKIYERQVNKQGMADRVVDEQQPQNRFGKKESDQLLAYEDRDLPSIDMSTVEQHCNDPVLTHTLKTHGHWVSQDPFKHESLLVEKQEYRLSRAEKRYAKESYEKEKRLCVSFSRPSYANYYQNFQHASTSTSTGVQPHFAMPYGHTSRSSVQPTYDYGSRTSVFPSTSANAVVQPQSLPTPVPRTSAFYHSSGPAETSNSRRDVTTPVTVRPGVTIQQMTVNRDIVVGEGGDGEPRCIRAGEQVLIIRTAKGMYLRTPDGKIFAVRSHRNGGGSGATAESLHLMLQEQQQHMQAPMQQSNGSIMSMHGKELSAGGAASSGTPSNPEMQSRFYHPTSSAPSSAAGNAETAIWTANGLPQFGLGLDEHSNGSQNQFQPELPHYRTQAVNGPVEHRDVVYSLPPDSNQQHSISFPSGSNLQPRAVTAAHCHDNDETQWSGSGASAVTPNAWSHGLHSSSQQQFGYSLDSASFAPPHCQSNYFASAPSLAATTASSSNLSRNHSFPTYSPQPYGTAFSGYGTVPTNAVLPGYSATPYSSSTTHGYSMTPVTCDSDDGGDDDDVAVVSAQQPSS